MELELEITGTQKVLIDGFAKTTGRGYIFVREDQDRLIATDVIPVGQSTELMRLSELQQVQIWGGTRGDGFIPYARADRWTAEHGKCAAAFYRRMRLFSQCLSLEDGQPRKVSLKGYGIICNPSVFCRFVEDESRSVSEKAMKLTVKGDPIHIDNDSIWLKTFYYLSKL